jgi:carboxymethylenebutenolidase
MRGLGPVIGCYGARDRMFGANGPKLEARLRPLGVEVETHTFAEVGHSFLTDGEHPIANRFTSPLLRISYDPAVAEDGWRRIFAFFERHL